MRHFLLLLLSAALLAAVSRAADTARAATPDEVGLFKEAIKNTQQDTERWAYTETTSMKVSKGKPPGETVVRFDPSKPWAEQYMPLQVEGKPPTARQLKKYRERGEKRGRELNRAAEAAAQATADGKPAPLGRSRRVSVDLEHPRVLREEEGRLVFEAPLVATTKDIPVDKFEVTVVVNRASRQVEHVDLRLREAFRVKLIAKIKEGEASATFASVDPQHGPVMVSATGNFGASVLFVPMDGIFTNTRTEWRRVKPYSDRLQVKLGPLEVLDF